MNKPSNRKCSVEGCEGRHLALGLCGKHYHRTRPKRPTRKKVRNTPCVDCGALIWEGSARCKTCWGLNRRRPERERLTEKYKVNADTGCWEWAASRNAAGYGSFDQTLAHRASWALFRGQIPDRLAVLHTCDNPPCVNPAHLFLGTDQDNANDKVSKRRHEFGEKHHKAKLTDAQVRAIRSDPRRALEIYESGNYPVSYSSICMIKKGRTWTNV